MGDIVHPLFIDEIPAPNTCPSLETEILQLIDRLIEIMGINGYCRWLANETPAAWVLDTPFAEIRDGLQNIAAELTPARVRPGGTAAGELQGAG